VIEKKKTKYLIFDLNKKSTLLKKIRFRISQKDIFFFLQPNNCELLSFNFSMYIFSEFKAKSDKPSLVMFLVLFTYSFSINISVFCDETFSVFVIE
jgi:hypothetical protein